MAKTATDFNALFESSTEACDFENYLLSISDALLPPVARRVRDRDKSLTDEEWGQYWAWAIDQVEEVCPKCGSRLDGDGQGNAFPCLEPGCGWKPNSGEDD